MGGDQEVTRRSGPNKPDVGVGGRTLSLSLHTHTHTHTAHGSVSGGGTTDGSKPLWCLGAQSTPGTVISITKQTALSSSASLSGRKMERYRVQSPDFNHRRGSTETGAEPLTQKQFHSCRNTELKYYKRLSFLPFLS